MFDLQELPYGLRMMGFTSSYRINFWAARITVPITYSTALHQAIDAVARELPLYRMSGYFLNIPDGDEYVAYQINRVPGSLQEALSDQALDLQLSTLLGKLNAGNVPYEHHLFLVPPQEERFCLLLGLGKGFSGTHFSGEQVWDVLQRQRTLPEGYQKVAIYAIGGGVDLYEEPALLVPCRDEADLHWLCATLLIFWQEWAVVYDRQELAAYRLVTALEALRDSLYSKVQEAS